MVKHCSKCEAAFDCCNEKEGCWCEEVFVPLETLAALKKSYDNCLCPDCLRSFSSPGIKPL